MKLLYKLRKKGTNLFAVGGSKMKFSSIGESWNNPAWIKTHIDRIKLEIDNYQNYRVSYVSPENSVEYARKRINYLNSLELVTYELKEIDNEIDIQEWIK